MTQQVKNISRTGSQTSSAGRFRQGQQITGKLKQEHRELFCAVLAEVMRKEVRSWAKTE